VTVESAYAEVERLTRREARNFAYGIMVLPRPKRQAIAAIYAFARRVDDIADGELPLEEKRAGLEALRAGLDSASEEPMLVALADARSRYGIPDRACTTSSTEACRTPSRIAMPISRPSMPTAASSPARSALPASRSTAPTIPSGRKRWAWRCS